MENKDYLYDWVFHYNIYNETWSAIPRDKYNDYWSNAQLEGVLRSKSYETLMEILHRTAGDISQLEKKINLKHD